MKILVTGGAGYIGSAAVKKLVGLNHEVVVIDNLSKGKKGLIDKKAKLYVGDLIDKEFVHNVFSNEKIEAVMHFASYKAAGESMERVELYSDNIVGTINLLSAMAENNVKKIIFSSSAAVYGNPEYLPVDENHPTDPINYYGFTKLEGEIILKWYSDLKNIIGVNLRYFNVAGDAGLNYVDPEAQNIFPILMEVLTGKREQFTIFGDKYNTKDGTCIRDYIDINDLIDAHVKALDLDKSETINLGTSNGVSVMELLQSFEREAGQKINYKIGDIRPGDPASLTASNEKAKKLLGWEPKVDLSEMVSSTIKAYKNQ